MTIILIAVLTAITALNIYLLVELNDFRKRQLKINGEVINALRVSQKRAQLVKEMIGIIELEKQLEKK